MRRNQEGSTPFYAFPELNFKSIEEERFYLKVQVGYLKNSIQIHMEGMRMGLQNKAI